MTNLARDDHDTLLLSRMSNLVGAHTGLALESAQWLDMRRALEQVAADIDWNWRLYAQALLDDRNSAQQVDAETPQLSALIDALTIGETYFFRDDALFAALREMVLPEVIERRRSYGRYLKLWSAGCSSGEEPYSLAIELARILPDIREWSVWLLATDINHRFLRKAERGIYAPWSLRDKSPLTLAPFIKPLANDRFEIIPALRRQVVFAPLNLATDDYPSYANRTSDMDVILCRHVLMYLRPTVINDVVARLVRALADGGWLITSSIEASLVDQPELETVRLHDIVLFRKQSAVSAISSTKASRPAPTIQPTEIHTAPLRPIAAQQEAISIVETISLPETTAPALDTVRALADKGELDAARAECERIIALDKLNREAHFLQASILLELGATEDAERALQRTLYLDSDHIPAHVALAMLALRARRSADTARHFRNARELLHALPHDAAVPGSDGLTAQQLSDMIDRLAATG